MAEIYLMHQQRSNIISVHDCAFSDTEGDDRYESQADVSDVEEDRRIVVLVVAVVE